MEENFDTLLSNGKEQLRRFGLWIVTEAYFTEACMIQTWAGRSREIMLDLKTEAMMAGELGPLFEWSKHRNADALSIYTNENYGSRVVVSVRDCAIPSRGGRVQLTNKCFVKPHAALHLGKVYQRTSEEPSSDTITSANGTKFEISWSLVINEDFSDEETQADSGSPLEGGLKDHNLSSEASQIPPRPASQT
ncbi:MAG: hypothetical protein Q9217_003748 [Psora testacea]